MPHLTTCIVHICCSYPCLEGVSSHLFLHDILILFKSGFQFMSCFLFPCVFSCLTSSMLRKQCEHRYSRPPSIASFFVEKYYNSREPTTVVRSPQALVYNCRSYRYPLESRRYLPMQHVVHDPKPLLRVGKWNYSTLYVGLTVASLPWRFRRQGFFNYYYCYWNSCWVVETP